MEQPARLDADSFRGTRVEALRGVATPSAALMRSHTVRAQYTAGTIGSRQVPSYVDEPGVDPSRNTETWVQERWQKLGQERLALHEARLG